MSVWASHYPHADIPDEYFETCIACQGQLEVIACVENRDVIKKILDHLKSNEEKTSGKLAQVRVTPVSVLT